MADHLREAVRKDLMILKSDDGETITTMGTNSSIRFIADKEVAPFALIHTRGNPDQPVVPHHHVQAVDTWLVLKGKLKVWANTEGRVLSSGDFAFVPRGVMHSFQVIEPHTEFIGLIHPSKWVDFFKAISEPWNGPGPFPSNDTRPFPIQKLMKALQDGHDVVPNPKYKFDDPLLEWNDSEVPEDNAKAYWVKAHTNRRWALGGQTLAPLVYHGASYGLFTIATLEGSSRMPHPPALSIVRYDNACFILFVQDGAWSLEIEGKEKDNVTLQTGDSAYIPQGDTWTLKPATIFARAIICSDGPGLTPIFTTAGEEISGMLGCAQANLTEKGELALKEAGERDGFALPGLDSKANR